MKAPVSIRCISLAVLACAAAVVSPVPVPAGEPAAASATTLLPATGLRMAGETYQTLRALSRFLDETAQGVLEGASDEVRHGTPPAARFLFSIRSFARSAADFRARVEEYHVEPFDVPAQVTDLSQRAHLALDGIRAARALRNSYGEWEALINVLDRLRMLLAGQEVEVPSRHVVPVLSGSSLDEFRQLAHDLDLSAGRAHTTAGRRQDAYSRGQQFLGELHYFAALSKDLHLRADAGDVEPQQIGPIVDRLLNEARQADRRMRDAKVFTEVWDDSGRTIALLERMATMVRS